MEMDINAVTLQALKEFVVLADICNYAAAAEELFISQATLSRHIMHLESLLDHQLFIRTTRSVELSSFGRDFLPFASQILETLDSCIDTLYPGTRTPDYKTIHLGIFSPFFYDDKIKGPIVAFFEDHPDYALDITQADEQELRHQLNDKMIDAAILRETVDIQDSFKRFRLTEEEALCLILPADSGYDRGSKVEVELFKNNVFIVPPKLTGIYRSFVEQCRELGFDPQLKSEISREASVNMVKRGQGILVRNHVDASILEDPALTVVIVQPQISSTTNILFRSTTKLTPPLISLIDYLKSSDII